MLTENEKDIVRLMICQGKFGVINKEHLKSTGQLSDEEIRIKIKDFISQRLIKLADIQKKADEEIILLKG